jgi:uncharacterized protein YndB with AHSA1/START domain
MTTPYKTFEVTWDAETSAAPEVVWDTITTKAAGWLWEVSYEPFAGGAERGLTGAGGTVSEWDPPRRFQTRLDEPDGHFNRVTYDLTPRAGGGTAIRYHHTTNVPADEHDVQFDACRAHTDLYRHSVLAVAEHFAGREPTIRTVAAAGTRDAVLAVLDGVGVVDYETGPFVGRRTDDALVRVYDRSRWDWGIEVSVYSFAGREAARAIIDRIPTTEKVA